MAFCEAGKQFPRRSRHNSPLAEKIRRWKAASARNLTDYVYLSHRRYPGVSLVPSSRESSLEMSTSLFLLATVCIALGTFHNEEVCKNFEATWTAELRLPRPIPDLHFECDISNNRSVYCAYSGVSHYLYVSFRPLHFNFTPFEQLDFEITSQDHSLYFSVHSPEEGKLPSWLHKRRVPIHNLTKVALEGSQKLLFLIFAGRLNIDTDRSAISVKPILTWNGGRRIHCSEKKNFYIKLYDHCPIGYDKKNVLASKNESHYCLCSSKQKNNILACHWDGQILRSPGYWIGYGTPNSSQQGADPNYMKHHWKSVVSVWCPNGYCNCSSSSSAGDCWFDVWDVNQQCANGRQGVLCGKCRDGYFTTIGSRRIQCVKSDSSNSTLKCTKMRIWKWILITVGMSFGIVFLSVLFNLNVTAGFLPPLVFFYQMVGFTLSPLPHSSWWFSQVADAIAEYSNFYIPFSKPICYNDSQATSKSNVALLYLPPLFVFAFMIIFAGIARLFSRVSRISVLRPFWSLITLTYPSIACTSFMILQCVKLDGRRYWYYGAHHECFTDWKQNLGYETIAFILLSAVFLFPFFVSLGIGSKRISRLFPLADVTVSAFKTKYWWAEGLNFGRRFLVVFATWCPLLVEGEPGYLYMLFTIVFIFASHSLLQPYARCRVNWMETLLLADLCAVTIFLPKDEKHHLTQWFFMVFFSIPYLIGILYFAYWIYTKVKELRKKIKKKRKNSDADSGDLDYILERSGDASETTRSESISVPLAERRRHWDSVAEGGGGGGGSGSAQGSPLFRPGSLKSTRRSYDPDEIMNESKGGLRDPLLVANLSSTEM